MRSSVFAACALAFFALLLTPSLASAQATFRSCAAAYEDAQRLQMRGELLGARARAAACGDPTCPAEIVGECTRLVDVIEASIPTIVVVASASGRDVEQASVFVDGVASSAKIDGRAIALDPGSHVVRVVPLASELPPRELRITVQQGDKNRAVRFVWDPVGPPSPPPARTSMGYVPAAVAFAVGGASLVAGGITGGFALSADADLDDRCDDRMECPPGAADDIDRLSALSTASTVTFVAGGVGVAVGIVLVLVAASSDDTVQADASGLTVRF